MSSYHHLDQTKECEIIYNDNLIERKSASKILGVHFHENLDWKEHVTKIVQSSYSAIRSLKQWKRFTPYNVRKNLAESLVLSKLNYNNVVFGQSPKYLLSRLQRVQNIAASYVFGKYVKEMDVIKLGWLPIVEHIEFATVKLVHQAINSNTWPSYLPLLVQTNSNSRLDTEMTIQHGEDKTFSDQATMYNHLPKNIRICKDFNNFKTEAKKYYKALARLLSL